NAVERRKRGLSASSRSHDHRALDRGAGPGFQPRAGLGYAGTAFECWPVLLAAELWSHGIHRYFDLDGPGAWSVGGAADQPRLSHKEQSEGETAASRRCRRGRGGGDGRAADQLGSTASCDAAVTTQIIGPRRAGHLLSVIL